MLRLEIYKKTSFRLLVYFLIGSILIFAAGHLLFRNGYVNGIMLLGVVVVAVLMSYLEKKPESFGNAIFNDNSIQITTPKDNLEFNLNSPIFIRINYGGYKDKLMVGDFVPRYNKYSGIDNLLIIKIEKKIYEFNFLVEDVYGEELLLDFVGSWKMQGFNVQFNE